MSDISPDSSFEFISDSDHSDVDEPSIAPVQLDDHSQNKDQSSAVKSKVLGPEVLGVLTSGKPTSPAKDIRVFDRACPTLVDKDVVVLGILLLVSFLFIGINALFSARPIPRNNSSPIVKIVNVTMVNQTNRYKWPKEIKQKMIDDARIGREEIEKAAKISEIRKSIQGMTHISQFPKNLWDKFIPDLSRFEGVDKFLQKTQTNGTKIEEYLYYSLPRFEVDKKFEHLEWIITGTSKYFTRIWSEKCQLDANCHDFYWSIKNGDLYITDKIVLESHKYKFTRVYFIPLHQMV